MFGLSYVAIGALVYLVIAMGHFVYFIAGIDRNYDSNILFGQYILLFLAGLFWPIAHVAYWVHLIRTR